MSAEQTKQKRATEKMGLYETALEILQTPMQGYMPELKEMHHVDFYEFEGIPEIINTRESLTKVCEFINGAIKASSLKPEDLVKSGQISFNVEEVEGKIGTTFHKLPGLDVQEMYQTVGNMIASAYVTTLGSWKNSEKIFPGSKSAFVEYREPISADKLEAKIQSLAYNVIVLNQFHGLNTSPDIRVGEQNGEPKIYMSKDDLLKYKALEKDFEKLLTKQHEL